MSKENNSIQEKNETDKTNLEILEGKFWKWLSEEYFKSWWFRIPIIILFSATLFAVVGVIQIQGIKVDVNEIANGAVNRVIDEISLYRQEKTTELDRYTDDQKILISLAVEDKVYEIKNAELSEFISSLDEIESSINRLEIIGKWALIVIALLFFVQFLLIFLFRRNRT